MAEVSLRDVRVMIALPVARDVHAETFSSLWDTHEVLLLRGVPVDLRVVRGSSLVHHARNILVNAFLQRAEATHLFWIDADVSWEPDAFLRLLALTQLEENPVVHAAYPARGGDETTFFLDEDCFGRDYVADRHGLLPLHSGIGFCCVRREVIETLAARARKIRVRSGRAGVEAIPRVFRMDDTETDAQGEDIWFFRDCVDAGFEVKLDPGIELGHHGDHAWRGRLRDRLATRRVA